MPHESRVRTRTPIYLGIVFLFWLVVYGGALFQPSLLDDADSVHAEAAREILIRHDWVTLHANGIRYLEKAPLLYWAMAASFRIFGVHDWSARLPLALGVLALLFAVYFLGRRAFSETAGFYGALACGLAFGPYIFTRFLIPDILVGLWLILTLGFFLRTLEEPEPTRLACWGLAAACALNVLTKGLIGLVFPLAAIGLYLLLTGNLRHLLKMRPASSSFVFLLIAVPWHVLAGLRNPTQGNVRGFFWFYLVNEHFLRYLNKRIPRDYGTVPLWLFWSLVLVWLFPWSSFLPQALARIPLLRIREASSTSAGRARLILLLGALLVVLFFSFSTRQEYYVLPALPALALLIGAWLSEEEVSRADSRLRKWGNASSAVLAALGLLAGAVAIFLALSTAPAPPSADIADLLHSGPKESEQYALSLGHFLDLNTRVMTLFHPSLFLFGFSLFAGTALNWYFRRRRRPDLGNWTLALMSVCLLVAVHIALVTFSPILTSKPLADAITRVYQPGDIIEINGEYEGGSTLNYYTGHQVRILNGRSANLWYGSFFPDAPQIFDDTSSFQRLWNGPQRIFLWTEIEKKSEAVQGINPSTVFVLAKYGDKLILTNQPVH
jgi:4-amino-4-deoxy-L-arabinose transferase-like glycosyltransferase